MVKVEHCQRSCQRLDDTNSRKRLLHRGHAKLDASRGGKKVLNSFRDQNARSVP